MSAAERLDDVVVVPGLKIKPGQAGVGVQVHWRLAGYLEQEKVDKALEGIVDSNQLPVKSSPTKYLERAMESIKLDRRSDLVRKAGRNGSISLIREDSNAIDLAEIERRKLAAQEQGLSLDKEEAYQISLTAKAVTDDNGNAHLVFTPPNHPQVSELKQAYEWYRARYSCSLDISQWLSVKIMKLVNATSYRDKGGLYVIPPGEDLTKFEKIVQAIHSITTFDAHGLPTEGAKFYMLPVVASDSLQEAIADSLMLEVAELHKDITTKLGQDTLTARGWEACRREVKAALTKYQKYEKFLQVDLSHLTDLCEEINNTVGMMEAARICRKKEEAMAKRA